MAADTVVGDANVKPESETEIETGFDATFLSLARQLSFTVYQKRISNLLLQAAVSASRGYDAQWLNGGEFTNQGAEIQLSGDPGPAPERLHLDLDDELLPQLQRREQPALLAVAPFNGIYPGRSISEDANANFLQPRTAIRPRTAMQQPSFFVSGTQQLTLRAISDLDDGRLVSRRQRRRRHGVLFRVRRRQPVGRIRLKSRRYVNQIIEGLDPGLQSATFVKMRAASVSYTLPARWVNTIGFGRLTSARLSRTSAGTSSPGWSWPPGGVTQWQAGDRVTVPFVCGCGQCEYCLAGNAQVCPRQTQPGFAGPGSFAEFVAVHAADANLVSLPSSVDFVTAACLGCRFATAFRAVTAHGRVRAGDWLAVHGCGGVGLSAVMIGAALGARVVAVDVVPAALDRARELGAEVTVDAGSGSDLAAAVAEITGGGAHVSIDAIGSVAVAANSVRCLRRHRRHIQVGLLPAGPVPLPMNLVIARELEIYGSHGLAARDYPPMMAMVADGTLRPGLLVGDVIGLADVGRALAAMDGLAGAGMTVVRLVV